MDEPAGPLRAVIVGAGHRGVLYGSYAEKNPDQLQVTAVVDPDPVRRERVGERFGVPAAGRFADLAELPAAGAIADVALNATMDRLHVPTSRHLLRAGYDVLLEKPIGVSAAEVLALRDDADRLGRIVMICHVLRFAPFYAAIRERILAGDVGDIINIQLSEHVSYHHIVMGFVRGKWNTVEAGGSSMLMSKSCHDLDLLTWFKSGIAPSRVTSAGNLMYFTPEQAPEGAGTRCLVDCAIEAGCPYSARKHYLEQNLWGAYVWHGIEHLGPDPTPEQKVESLRTDNPFGRCVWQCDNTVVDHQSVLVEFADGATGTLSTVGNSAKPCRTVRIIGTDGEIDGVMEDGRFVVRKPDPRAGHEYAEEPVEFDVRQAMHGGGDLRLVADFVNVVRRRPPSISTTTLADSVNGHLVGFAADQAVAERRWVDLAAVREPLDTPA
ncbi:MAG TPA: Gfo/Idh/MocA family oxidoreductase [Mycobacteriales bacterium]|nr:Gfo/Idh/MocA family oxidoreductase [Mycobacteriales bacterium]